jgi:ADP-heptose:LPS heptosyltransferase
VKEGRGRILVIRGGAIGDFILTLPALTALRRRFRESHLEVLGYPHIAQLALAGGLADEVRSIEARALAGFFAPGGSLDEKQGNYFADFALVVSYLYDLDGVFQANVARCSKAQFIAGPHRPDAHLNLHATDVFLRPLERLAIFDADPVPRLELISSTDIPVPPGRWLALHPGSGSEKKNWPEENWRQLVAGLVQSTEFSVLLVGGEAEGDRLQRLSKAVPGTRCQLAQGLPLVVLAQRLKQCVGFVGHDSGISHLAGALGLRGLVLWSDTDETLWRPRSERMSLLRHPGGITKISVRSVARSLSTVF